MEHRDLVLDAMRRMGRAIALELQERAQTLTGTQLYAEADYIPSFSLARAKENMLSRPIGFLCRTPEGRVVRLLQNYNSDTYPEVPEELPAQWGFYWSADPAKALPFLSLSTSPYNTGDCCTYQGHVWRSGQDANVWAPGVAGAVWEDLGSIPD